MIAIVRASKSALILFLHASLYSASRGRLKYFCTCGPRMAAVVAAVLTCSRARLNPLKTPIADLSCRVDILPLPGQLSTGDCRERFLGLGRRDRLALSVSLKLPRSGDYRIRYRDQKEFAQALRLNEQAQAAANLGIAMSVLRRDEDLVTWLSDRLLAIAETVPDSLNGFRLGGSEVFSDRRIFDVANYPDSMWKKPGEKAPNRAGLGAWGAYVNTLALRDYGRPLFIAASADLAESTNIAGFGQDYGGLPGTGWYERSSNPFGALLPTEITEFTNAGMMAGLATVNLASDPFSEFDGFWGACSTYGSFSYLKYGPMRLFSQLAQDTELKVGKLLWIAGHSGPETAEDSRTHFGIFSSGSPSCSPKGT